MKAICFQSNTPLLLFPQRDLPAYTTAAKIKNLREDERRETAVNARLMPVITLNGGQCTLDVEVLGFEVASQYAVVTWTTT